MILCPVCLALCSCSIVRGKAVIPVHYNGRSVKKKCSGSDREVVL